MNRTLVVLLFKCFLMTHQQNVDLLYITTNSRDMSYTHTHTHLCRYAFDCTTSLSYRYCLLKSSKIQPGICNTVVLIVLKTLSYKCETLKRKGTSFPFFATSLSCKHSPSLMDAHWRNQFYGVSRRFGLNHLPY